MDPGPLFGFYVFGVSVCAPNSGPLPNSGPGSTIWQISCAARFRIYCVSVIILTITSRKPAHIRRPGERLRIVGSRKRSKDYFQDEDGHLHRACV